MEAQNTLLRSVSRKVSSSSTFIPKSGLPKVPGAAPVKKTWLLRTIQRNGTVKPAFQPLLSSLANLEPSTDKLKQVTLTLNEKKPEDALELWQEVISGSSPNTNSQKFGKWETLTKEFGNHGPQSFASTLNKICRVHTDFPGLVKNVVFSTFASNPSLSPYVFGTCLEKVAAQDGLTAAEIYNHVVADCNQPEIVDLGLDAMFYGVKMEPSKLLEILNSVKIPESYKSPSKFVAMLYKYSSSIQCADVSDRLAAHIDPAPAYDRLSRRVYTSSDKGARIIEKIASQYASPITFYPFVVKRLCERVTNSKPGSERDEKISQMNQLFEGPSLKLAESSPQILLYLLVVRTIALEGVAATAPILNKWQESDEQGVSTETWMSLFTNFRRSGHPDKCSEVLSRNSRVNPLVNVEVVSEYSHFTAHYYHLHAYLTASSKIIPEAQNTSDFSGISEYARHIPDPVEPPLCQLKPELTSANRGFPSGIFHESWLVATYNAVLSTVESVEVATASFGRYMEYMHQLKTRTSLKVTDHFVDLLAVRIGGPAASDAAVDVFNRALNELSLNTAVDGRNHAKSLEVSCYQSTASGQTERAIKLLMSISENPKAIVRGSALGPMLRRLPPELREGVVKWAEQVGANVEPSSSNIQESFSA